MSESDTHQGLYIMLLSIHGLVRGEDLELGRDPDTGGQVKYVVELARALSGHPQVDRVDLLTRNVIDKKVDPGYAQSVEQIAECAYIIRIPCGPKRYLRKEKLWPYLDNFTDHILYHIRMVGRVPDLVHGHYADAGYVGSQLARLLGLPFVFTGHSLGRVKRARLLEKGAKESTLESQYHFRERIEAEETALDTAVMVVASTHQEVEDQYELYDHYQPKRMVVIPPGVDLSRFFPLSSDEPEAPIAAEVERFLHDPTKPIIMAMARPDDRKNFPNLIKAYAKHPELKKLANLLLVIGNRENIETMEAGARRVLNNILLLLDKYDLYGSVAYPKQHAPDDVPALYRLVAGTRGIFVNPALTEPFGLTLIEAAASGLPIVATNDGGPRDIVEACRNGVLIDPLQVEEIGESLYQSLTDRDAWTRRSQDGVAGAHRHFSWDSHLNRYVDEVQRILKGEDMDVDLLHAERSRLPTIDRILITDIDNTLTGDSEGLDAFLQRLEEAGNHIGFGIATGRRLETAQTLLADLQVPQPDVLITSVGTEIYYGRNLTPDRSWRHHIDYLWEPEEIQRALNELPGLNIQEDIEQQAFKISYLIDPEEAPPIRGITRHLRQRGLRANVVYSLGTFLDIVPIRASSGLAIRFLTFKWGLPPERLLIAGDSGNDEEMLSGNTLGVVVGNYSPELEPLRGKPRIYFADSGHAWGIIEGIDYYNFFDEIQIPEEVEVEL